MKTASELLQKHYPGQHDQSTHGDWDAGRMSGGGGRSMVEKLKDKLRVHPLGEEISPISKPAHASLSEFTHQYGLEAANEMQDRTRHSGKTLKAIVDEQWSTPQFHEVSKEELDHYISAHGEVELFRGDSNLGHDRVLKKGRMGLGMFGDGVYTAAPKGRSPEAIETALKVAGTYAYNSAPNFEFSQTDPDVGTVARMSIKSGANIIEVTKLSDLYAKSPDHEVKINGTPWNVEISVWAAAHGYDAIHLKDENYYVILNRSAVRVQRERLPHSKAKPMLGKSAVRVVNTLPEVYFEEDHEEETALEFLLKHFPGQHDQSTHGNWDAGRLSGGVTQRGPAKVPEPQPRHSLQEAPQEKDPFAGLNLPTHPNVIAEHEREASIYDADREFAKSLKASLPEGGITNHKDAIALGGKIADHIDTLYDMKPLRKDIDKYTTSLKFAIMNSTRADLLYLRSGAIMKYNFAFRLHAAAVLGSMRESAGENKQLKLKLSGKGNADETIIRSSMSHIPKSWEDSAVAAQNPKKPLSIRVTQRAGGVGGGQFDAHKNEIEINAPPDTMTGRQVAQHELTHFFMSNNPVAAKMEYDYYFSRAGSEKPTFRDVGAGSKASAVKDKWAIKYAGSAIWGGRTPEVLKKTNAQFDPKVDLLEVTTTGVDGIFSDRYSSIDFGREDRSHRSFTLGMLAGVKGG